MNRSFLQMLVRRAEHVAARPGADAPGDEQLLARFAREGDEAAFAALLARHGRLVWSVCRGLLPRDADAEDAFQATFLALVRGAKSVKSRTSLAPWLHVTATRVCKKVRLAAARRNGREHKAAVHEATPSPVPEAAWEAASLAVHEEIAALSSTLRTAFVTCVLEGERHQDAAARLGVPVGTLSARVSRARQTLLDRLGARGLAPGVAAAALALGGAAGPAAVPDILTEAVRGLLPAGTSATPYLITLATTATDGVTMKVKMLAAAVLIAGAASFTTGGWVLNRAEAQAAAAPPAPTSNPLRFADPAVAAPRPATSTPRDDTYSAPSAWQYDMVRRPANLVAFRALLESKSGAGWEYTGSESLGDGDGEPVSYCVFKKPSAYNYRTISPAPFPASEVNTVPPPLSRSAVAPPAAAADTIPYPTPVAPPARAIPVPTPVDDSLPTPRPPRAKPGPLDISAPPSSAAPVLPNPIQPVATAPSVDRHDRVLLRNVAATDAARAVEQFVQNKYKDVATTVRVFPDAPSNSLVVKTAEGNVLNDIHEMLQKLDAPANAILPYPTPTPELFNPINVVTPTRPTLRDLYESTAPPVSVVVTLNHVVPSRAAKALKSYLRSSVPDAPEVTVDSDDAKNRIDLKGPNELVKKLAGLVRELDREATPSPMPSVPKPTAVKP
jgi:RNA polymerase sigma factor (sigma-70 family)